MFECSYCKRKYSNYTRINNPELLYEYVLKYGYLNSISKKVPNYNKVGVKD